MDVADLALISAIDVHHENKIVDPAIKPSLRQCFHVRHINQQPTTRTQYPVTFANQPVRRTEVEMLVDMMQTACFDRPLAVRQRLFADIAQ